MKDKALQELRKQYKEYLNGDEVHQDAMHTYYEGAKYFAIKIGLLSRLEIETMETGQEDMYNNNRR